MPSSTKNVVSTEVSPTAVVSHSPVASMDANTHAAAQLPLPRAASQQRPDVPAVPSAEASKQHDDIIAPTSPLASSSSDFAAALPAATKGGFSLEGLVQSTLQDELSDLRQTLHDDVQNMHVELIRQFETQQQALVALFDGQMQRLNAVIVENQTLRRENERLSVMYE